MKRAVVVRMFGDADLAAQIAEPMTRVIPVDDDQMQMVIAENKRLNALNGVRSYGDSVRFESVSKAMAVKYSTPSHGRLYEAILGVWALLWLTVHEWFEYFQAWNREDA